MESYSYQCHGTHHTHYNVCMYCRVWGHQLKASEIGIR
jgi:hypothetical protein